MRVRCQTILLLCCVLCMAESFNKLMVKRKQVHDIQKAQIYLQKTILLYERGRQDKYSLYLAVKNYADRLGLLEEDAIDQIEQQYPQSSAIYHSNFYIQGKISSKSLSRVGKKILYDQEKELMYFKRWVIDLNHLLLIQDNPELVITRRTTSSRSSPSSRSSRWSRWTRSRYGSSSSSSSS